MEVLLKRGEGIPAVDSLEELQLGFSTTTHKLYTKIDDKIIEFGKDNNFLHYVVKMPFDPITQISLPSNTYTSALSGTDLNTVKNAAQSNYRDVAVGPYTFRILVTKHSSTAYRYQIYFTSTKSSTLLFKSSYDRSVHNVNFCPQPLGASQRSSGNPLSISFSPGQWYNLAYSLTTWQDVLVVSLKDPDSQITITTGLINFTDELNANAESATKDMLNQHNDNHLWFDIIFNRRIDPFLSTGDVGGLI
jgi:hypothetical protein